MTGIMYWDNSIAKTFIQRVEDCIAQYKQKVGADPKIILVNNTDFINAGKPKFRIQIEPEQYMLLNHFWLGESQS